MDTCHANLYISKTQLFRCLQMKLKALLAIVLIVTFSAIASATTLEVISGGVFASEDANYDTSAFGTLSNAMVFGAGPVPCRLLTTISLSNHETTVDFSSPSCPPATPLIF